MNICFKGFVMFHSKVSTKCHILLEAANFILFADNSIMENTQKEVVKRISLDNQVAFLSYVCLEEGSGCW